MLRFGNDDDLDNTLGCLIKIGEVSSIDPVNCTARVVFDDDDSLVSRPLKVLQRNTLKSKDYHLPALGEDVVCVFLPNATEEGFIIGSFYAGEVKPPESTETKRTVLFADGTRVCYDTATGSLSVIGAKAITLNAPSVTLDGNVAITGALTVGSTVTAIGDVVGAGVSLESHTHTNGNNGSPTGAPIK